MPNDSASPFDLLLDIRKVSEGVSAIGPTPVLVDEQWVGVGFRVAGQDFVADMNQVGEVLTPPSLTAVPGVKQWVLGVANIRGRLVPIIDLQLFFGQEKASSLRSRRVITIDVEDTFVGIVVEQVYGMKHCSVSDYDAELKAAQVSPEVAQHLRGAYKVGDEVWPLFDLSGFVHHDSFLEVAA